MDSRIAESEGIEILANGDDESDSGVPEVPGRTSERSGAGGLSSSGSCRPFLVFGWWPRDRIGEHFASPSESSTYSSKHRRPPQFQRSLATDIQKLMMEFYKKQSTYLKNLRQQKEGQYGVDLEMNHNGIRSKSEVVDFVDMMSQLKKKGEDLQERGGERLKRSWNQ